MGKDLTIRANSVYAMVTYFEAAAFLKSAAVPLDDMMSHRFSIEQAPEAFELFDSRKYRQGCLRLDLRASLRQHSC